MKKRLVSVALAIVLAFALIPLASAASFYIEVIPLTYDDAGFFSEGLAAVKLDDKWGYIDATGKVVIPFEYDYASYFRDGEAFVEIVDGEEVSMYLIDKTGKIVFEYEPSDYDPDEPYEPIEKVYTFYEGLLATKDGDWEDNGKYGFVDEDWDTVIEPLFDDAENFSEGLAAVCIDDGWGFIDKTGKVIIALEYDDANDFSEGFATVRVGDVLTGKWGVVDKKGNLVIPPSFDDVSWDGFQEGLLAIQIGDWETGKWGFIAPTLGGAADWAVPELITALENDLVLDEMIGKWAQPTNRLLAAEAIVTLIEAITGKSVDEIAEEFELDMEDEFIDCDNAAVTFLKASGISNGMDGESYDPDGTFTRAQMVTMLGRMAKNLLDIDTESFPKGSETFTDVPDWADEFIGWAVAAKITNGVSETLFDSNGTLSNQHTGVFAYRAFDHFAE